MEITDTEALNKIKRGEIDHFSVIVRRYSSRIRLFTASRVFDKLDVDDLVQNSFLKFYRAIGRFDSSKPVLPYLYQVVRNELKMYYRAKKKTYSLADWENQLIDIEEDKSLGLNLEELINELPSSQRKAMELISQGYSYDEVARQLNRGINTIKTWIRRSRNKLKSLYGKNT